MAKRKICIVTAARSEYSASKWLMLELSGDPDVELQVVVTGSHLESRHGLTVEEIERDGIPIAARVPMMCDSDTPRAVAESMGRCALGMAQTMARLEPDLLVVLGDRYELLPICSAATMLNIPIAHISGGDITEGAVDDAIRHAVTKLAHLHFPGTERSAKVLRQLGEDESRIFVVGEPGLDNFNRLDCLDRETLGRDLGMAPDRKWVLLTYHPETRTGGDDSAVLANIFHVLDQQEGIQVMMTYPNADPGSGRIVDLMREKHAERPDRYRLEKSLGQLRFISILKQAWCMVGNSSSILFEAPSAKLPAILVGDRQKGRLSPVNVIPAAGNPKSLQNAFELAGNNEFRAGLRDLVNPYGDGHTACRVAAILKKTELATLLKKPFVLRDCSLLDEEDRNGGAQG
ncbi:GDP/UDP-N,N'-diacetylbacillosamine 2-epimerase (hydrolyzing) [Pseudodesulfovibrio hydrargyri]|uniref:GDP/UDP-N,N'-diacetylbacillosamine 2-epimerase (Hydrolyzing) n=1 Tax=Pseudodesulfovibrio hydrargyri TaxID=2125990 RepID=A0A1J5N7F9_9BACT|nr:UDP-N-acetylglucosamine 2-epimerase [Pseudodesulfovibrio hydrargyri]OIQ49239.1 GDP/UDP-N,N'-diacetylbacillosamine 2-epimerase (hydrolyzing) [Pseudodesulfovibrio hydrargyri]